MNKEPFAIKYSVVFVKETVWNVFLDRFFFFVSIFFENNLFYASVTCEFLFSENHIRKYLSKVCIYDFLSENLNNF